MLKNRARGIVVTLVILAVMIGASVCIQIQNVPPWMMLIIIVGTLLCLALAMVSGVELLIILRAQKSTPKWWEFGGVLVVIAVGAVMELSLQWHHTVWFTLVVCIPTVNDSMAMVGGKTLGKLWRRKINRAISPNKTWAGVVCGIISSLVVFIPLNAMIWQWRAQEFTFIILTLAIWANMGDFLLSQLKRVVGVKDFSNLLGANGHGGILDRFGNHYPLAILAGIMQDYRGDGADELVGIVWIISFLCAVFYCITVSDYGEQE